MLKLNEAEVLPLGGGMTGPFIRIQEHQREWALQCKGRTKFTDYQDNFFEELKPDAKNEYASGDGHELKSHMYSLISSSALCCNFFHHWRYRNSSKLCQSLSIQGNLLQFRFEAKLVKPAGIGGPNPNVDVLIANDNQDLTAIECKFTEPYKPLSPRAQASMMLAPSYFSDGINVWQAMSHCYDIARRLPHLEDGDAPLCYLAVDQLIKHAVGLLNTYPWKNWRLVYLWYDDGSDVGQAHRKEIERFTKAIGDDFRFENKTYQDLFSLLCNIPDTGKDGWTDYMRQRYFPDR
jgi:hypothetical protein